MVEAKSLLETMKKIKSMNVKEPEINTEVLPLSKNIFFNFEKKKVPKNHINLEFINNLKLNCHTDMNTFNKFGRYFFDLNGAYLEIFISIEEDEIIIEPYLIYKDSIKKNIQKIIYREFFLYCIFKKNLMQ